MKILGVDREGTTDRVTVSLLAVTSNASPVQRDADGKPLESGIYDLRLFRDGQLVEPNPDLRPNREKASGRKLEAEDLDEWRLQHRLLTTGEQLVTISHVRVPQQKSAAHVVFKQPTHLTAIESRVARVSPISLHGRPFLAEAHATGLSDHNGCGCEPVGLGFDICRSKRQACGSIVVRKAEILRGCSGRAAVVNRRSAGCDSRCYYCDKRKPQSRAGHSRRPTGERPRLPGVGRSGGKTQEVRFPDDVVVPLYCKSRLRRSAWAVLRCSVRHGNAGACR